MYEFPEYQINEIVLAAIEFLNEILYENLGLPGCKTPSSYLPIRTLSTLSVGGEEVCRPSVKICMEGRYRLVI